MQIALVCPYSLDQPGGVGSHVLGFAAWAAGRGQEVLVVAPGTGTPVVPGVEVATLGRAFPVLFNGSTAHLALGPSQVRSARRLVAGADVVHVHEPLTPGLAHAVASASPRLVVTHHASFPVGAATGFLMRRHSARLGPRTTLAVSSAAARTARALTGHQPAVVPNAIALPPPPMPRAGWRGGARPRVGFLGRLDDRRKGLAVYQRLAELAQQGGLDAEFVSAGPGAAPGRPVAHQGCPDNAGRAAYLAGLDVLVAPNTRGESFGLVIVEAMAAGCDVVVSDLPAFAEVVQEAGVGRVFRAGDPAAALDALRSTLLRPTPPLTSHAAAARWGWDAVGPQVLAALVARSSP